jgi:formylglycine-generating enzyme required for sulfatase activity
VRFLVTSGPGLESLAESFARALASAPDAQVEHVRADVATAETEAARCDVHLAVVQRPDAGPVVQAAALATLKRAFDPNDRGRCFVLFVGGKAGSTAGTPPLLRPFPRLLLEGESPELLTAGLLARIARKDVYAQEESPFGALVLHERFQFSRTLGHGQVTDALLCWDVKANGSEVVLKRLRPERNPGPAHIYRFRTSAERMASFNHPAVCRMRFSSPRKLETPWKTPYTIVDYVPGGTLGDWVAGRKFGAYDALRTVVRASEAVGHAHGRRYLHRQFHPGNVLMEPTGEPKLTDFSVALDTRDTIHTPDGRLAPHWIFLAPEVVADGRIADMRGDVFSVARMVTWALWGEALPWEMLSDTRRFIANLECGDVVKQVLERGQSIHPKDRPTSVRSFTDALAKAMRAPGAKPGYATRKAAPPVVAATGPSPAPVIDPANPRLGAFTPGQVAEEGTNARPDMVYIPSGQYTQGSPPSERGRQDGEGPRRVVLTVPFLMSSTPITQGQYRVVTEEGPSYFKQSQGGTPNHPVENLTWVQAINYCNKLSRLERRTPAWQLIKNAWVPVSGADGYTLPSEAQWEWAARAGSVTRFWCGPGDDALDEVAWCARNAGGRTHAVGEKRRPNPWGLHDLHGNVWEWCADTYADALVGDVTDSIPLGVGPRAVRGGSFYSGVDWVRAASRAAVPQDDRWPVLGFRVVRPLLPPDALPKPVSE